MQLFSILADGWTLRLILTPHLYLSGLDGGVEKNHVFHGII